MFYIADIDGNIQCLMLLNNSIANSFLRRQAVLPNIYEVSPIPPKINLMMLTRLYSV